MQEIRVSVHKFHAADHGYIFRKNGLKKRYTRYLQHVPCML